MAVADKNYDNAGQIAGRERRDEGLPFAAYLTGLALWRQAEGAPAAEMFRPRFLPGDAEATIDPAWLLPGANRLLLVGNEPLRPQGASDSLFVRELHPGGDESADLYVGWEDVVAPLRSDRTVRMFRAKGKLLILPDGLPSDVVGIEATVDNLYRNVGRDLSYADSAGVVKRFALTRAAGELSLLAAPGRAPGSLSTVTLRLVKRDGASLTLSNIPAAIRRNRISVIRPICDRTSGAWSLEVFADGRWTQVEELHID